MAKKKISIRRPELVITRKGPRLRKPSVRIGGKAGVNVSRSGVSGSVRTGAGSVNTKRGLRLRLPWPFGKKRK